MGELFSIRGVLCYKRRAHRQVRGSGEPARLSNRVAPRASYYARRWHAMRDPEHRPDPVQAVLAILILLNVLMLLAKL